jgi:hypothetical protein
VRTFDRVLDELWRGFPPKDRAEYGAWQSRLKQLWGNAIETGNAADVLRIESALVTLAYADGDDLGVLSGSESIARNNEFSLGEAVATSLFRIQALHRLNRHNDECAFVQRIADEGKSLAPEDLVVLLSSLIRHHPKHIVWTPALRQRLADALAGGVFREFSDMQPRAVTAPELDDVVLQLANDLERWNLQQAELFS